MVEIQCPKCKCTFKKDREKRKYCSRSCAVSINNSLFPKVRYTHFCRLCKCRISAKAKMCKSCFNKIYYKELVDGHGEKSLQEIKLTHLGTAYQWNNIRTWAKRLMIIWEIPKVCAKCKWEFHVEVSHKKAISSFPLTTKVKEVNSKENLEYLCPNCHWLFENNVVVAQRKSR